MVDPGAEPGADGAAPPLLSILVPTYRRAGPLALCLASIEAAGLPADAVEILVCDNASPDGTPAVLAAHRSRHRLRYERRPENLGALRNIRLGAGLATGRWLMFLTDDDRLDAEGARALLPVLRADRGVGFIVSAFRDVTEDGRVVGGWSPSAVDQELAPGAATAAAWGGSGWVISRLVFRREVLDFTFWDRHLANAYPSMLFAARALLHGPGLYLARPLVDHTVGNQVHWEEFGDGQYAIWRKTHLDHAEVLDVVYADAGIDTPAARAAAEGWRHEALRNFIEALDRRGGAARQLRADRSALARAFGVPLARVEWWIMRTSARRAYRALVRWLAARGVRRPGRA